jgi:hypothetical protein
MARVPDLAKMAKEAGGMPPPMPPGGQAPMQFVITQEEVYRQANFSFVDADGGHTLVQFDIVTGMGAIKRITLPFARVSLEAFRDQITAHLSGITLAGGPLPESTPEEAVA